MAKSFLWLSCLYAIPRDKAYFPEIIAPLFLVLWDYKVNICPKGEIKLRACIYYIYNADETSKYADLNDFIRVSFLKYCIQSFLLIGT